MVTIKLSITLNYWLTKWWSDWIIYPNFSPEYANLQQVIAVHLQQINYLHA